jgi:hypothetical protein
MREVYIGIEPSVKGKEVEMKDLSLIYPFEDETYICYGHNEVPDFSPQNFILILDSATALKEKKLKEYGYKIHKKEFQMKRIFTDNNRQEVFNDIKKIEPLHLYVIGKNADKIPDMDMERLSQSGSLIYSVNNDFIKGSLIFGIKPSKIPMLRY